MTYIDAHIERDKNEIHVVERINGKRVFNTYPTKYVVYWPDKTGKYKNIFGQPCSMFQTHKYKEFQKELRTLPSGILHESDINPIFRCLYDNYKGKETPKLHIGFFDIEVDFSPEKGFSSTDDAFSPIIAISLYLNWENKLYTLVLKPKNMTEEDASEITNKFENTYLCKDEKELLEIFLQLIDDVDILTGYNSEGYDIPYTVNRIIQILGKDETRKLCLWNKLPKKRVYEAFGREQRTYDLIGRIHLDYMQLYRKYTYHEMHSYRLDFVGEYEVGEKKVAYEGTLDKLYNNDFEKFIAYNRQDVMLMVKIDNKNKFIDLSNALAHDNCVLLQTTMGAVALIDQAIVNEAHELGMVVPNKKRREAEPENDDDDKDASENNDTVVGGYVADPKTGMHQWIGILDINSLYPSGIRALNMSPETLIGHIRPDMTTQLLNKRIHDEKASFADSWNEMFSTLEYEEVMKQSQAPLTVDFEDGSVSTLTASELYELVFNSGNPFIISANGTIFTYEKYGIIPGLLSKWYSGRKELQAKMKEFDKLYNEETDEEKKIYYKEQRDFYDQRQLIRKILLNSLYGSLTNVGSRFFDQRIGQSTTLSGRTIVRHMSSKVNEILVGRYNLNEKCRIYNDTDSVHFSAFAIKDDNEEFNSFEWTKDNVTYLYDGINDIVNSSFPDFMKKAFNCPLENGKIIKAGRELCGTTSLYIKKKRYAVLAYDKEGTRKDINGKSGEIKAMGLDLKRSDTPKVMQDFLSEILSMLLNNKEQNEIQERIKSFRQEFKNWPSWVKGTPKRVNKLTYYESVHNNRTKKDGKNITVPGHVLASINWNKLKKIYNDPYSMTIQDGFKVIVCKLKPNPSGITSVAYPIDELNLPKWFKELPFDDDLMEETIIDKKIHNLLGVLHWDLNMNKTSTSFDDLFKF